jgi:4-carboxymuconolactone decarboxylase
MLPELKRSVTMKKLAGFALFVAVTIVAIGQGKLPPDVDPKSYNRLPVIKREQLDAAGKKAYDLTAGGAGKVASPTGPSAISLYSPGVAEPMRMLNSYLRRENNLLGKQVTELAILTTAREFDSNYIWSAHEPTALKVGVPQATVDVIKFRKDASGVAGKEGLVINVGRQIFRDHKLDSATYAKAMDAFGKQGLVELVAIMGDYSANALFLHTFDQHVPPDRKPLLPMK